MSQHHEGRAGLQRQREELLERIEAIKADYASGLDHDFEEQAQQLENAEVLEALLKQAYDELALIDSKLDRLNN